MSSSVSNAPRNKPTKPESSSSAAAEGTPLGMPSLEHGRLSLLPPYLAMRINAQNEAIRARGEDLIDLGMGNPVDPVADNVIAELKKSVENPANHRYAPSTGLPALKEAFARHYARQFGVTLDPKKEAIVSLGSKDAFSHLCLAILTEYDSCVVPTPAYTPHLFAPRIAGAQVVGLVLDEETPGQKMLGDLKTIFDKTSPRPKFAILNFPHNPTARTVDLPFYEEVVALAKHYKFWLLNDFAYGHTCFDGYKAPSILQVKGAKDVAVEMFTMSKPYSMAGWRIGFLGGNAQLIDALARIKPYFDYGHFFSLQHAAITALDTGDGYIAEQSKIYQRRRDALLNGLEQNGWGKTIKNRGTMFTWQRIPEQFRELGSIQFCSKLAEESGVAFFPGAGFGPEGEGFVRMAMVEPDTRITEATKRVGAFLKK